MEADAWRKRSLLPSPSTTWDPSASVTSSSCLPLPAAIGFAWLATLLPWRAAHILAHPHPYEPRCLLIQGSSMPPRPHLRLHRSHQPPVLNKTQHQINVDLPCIIDLPPAAPPATPPSSTSSNTAIANTKLSHLSSDEINHGCTIVLLIFSLRSGIPLTSASHRAASTQPGSGLGMLVTSALQANHFPNCGIRAKVSMRKIGFKLHVMRLNHVESFYTFLLHFRSEGNEEEGREAATNPHVGPATHGQAKGPCKGAIDCSQGQPAREADVARRGSSPHGRPTLLMGAAARRGGACEHDKLWPTRRGGSCPRAHSLAAQHPQRRPAPRHPQGAAASRGDGAGRSLAGCLLAGKGSSYGGDGDVDGARGFRASF
ncbi:hypothetical protein GW17_00035161 [Ensete ventricosum]|nr:hypothetical protein GW17_00035161 [Ensete ventricosum]